MVLFRQGRVTEEIPLFQAISYLQPRFRATWSFGAWHMAYNVSADFYDRKDLSDEEVDRYRYDCFEIAERFLRKGIRQNYYHYDLHWDLGFTILYYKKYKLIREKGWAREEEALEEALEEMKIASLFRPPLGGHPAYVDRIIAIIMREGGMVEEAYKMWYRLNQWHKEEQNVNLIRKHVERVVKSIETEETKAYALDLEKEGKLAEAYKVWYNLLTTTQKGQTELAGDQYADVQSAKEIERNLESSSESVRKLGEVLTRQGADVKSLEKEAVEEGRLPDLQKRIDGHFRSLEQEAKEEEDAARAMTMEMYRDLTKPAPSLDWWVLLFVPLLLLAGGYLIFGKETYAS
jgi:hypothetical protein